MGHKESSPKRKTYSPEFVQKETRESISSSLASHLEALERKEANSPRRSRQQEIIKQGRNQPNENKKNYTKNQPNQELVL